jgi:hypothetical protein
MRPRPPVIARPAWVEAIQAPLSGEEPGLIACYDPEPVHLRHLDA